VDASGSVRFLRYAPDSARTSDAQPSSFADIKVGDQLRVTGERASDGTSFRADEIIAGSFTRVLGQITSVDAARGELTVKNDQTGQSVTVAFGPRSTLRRVTPEFVKTVTERAERARAGREQRTSGGGAGQTNAGGGRGEGRREGEGARREGGGQRGPEGQRRGGGGFQQMFDSLPAITVADLKKGDVVVVTATPGADNAHVTAITLVTGEADFLRRMRQFQRGGEGGRGMSPGLAGDIIGATVTVTDSAGVAKTATTDEQGNYVFTALAPGRYTLRVTQPGFAPYENQGIEVQAGRTEPLNVVLTVAIEQEVVTVTAESPTSTEPESNAGAVVLRGADLDALPDDPDDLSEALQALAGPSSGS